MIGMLILRIPYAPMVGALVGVTALIPVIGGFIGAGVGAVMILTQNPLKALIFVIFIMCSTNHIDLFSNISDISLFEILNPLECFIAYNNCTSYHIVIEK